MNVIGIYNADAERLQTALDAMEDSEFTWYVRGYALEMAMELGHWDRNPTEADLLTLMVKAKTRRLYPDDLGRAKVFFYLDRALVGPDVLTATCAMLEEQARAQAAELAG
jgi:hypothetical protein